MEQARAGTCNTMYAYCELVLLYLLDIAAQQQCTSRTGAASGRMLVFGRPSASHAAVLYMSTTYCSKQHPAYLVTACEVAYFKFFCSCLYYTYVCNCMFVLYGIIHSNYYTLCFLFWSMWLGFGCMFVFRGCNDDIIHSNYYTLCFLFTDWCVNKDTLCFLFSSSVHTITV